jgi:hypothetical protein
MHEPQWLILAVKSVQFPEQQIAAVGGHYFSGSLLGT